MTENMYVQLTKRVLFAVQSAETDSNEENSKIRAVFWTKHTLVWK